ncbi:hypothetical protein AMATHDRAFT_2698 [Amanita thiersii Skay4041]|uniref:Uncharacterized protein n=1 Tax=Amanita thiersii Skay4041 TaxID=703135 RepID=A0A2A9NLC6_9AGAR|nr:hypothetical protein AMATHDRAFT_2698 [Amanita thiersii Skay4041]
MARGSQEWKLDVTAVTETFGAGCLWFPPQIRISCQPPLDDSLSAPSLNPRPSQASTHPTIPKPLSQRRLDTPGTDVDDNASIAESVRTTGKIRRTEAERILYFKNQPECTNLEPHRVFCTRCETFVNLGQRQTYSVRPWELHRTKCDSHAGDHPHNSATPTKDEAKNDAESAASFSTSDSPVRRTEAERKAILESDTKVEEVQPNQVKCKTCGKWIKLSNQRSYVLHPWQRHREHCGAAVPSSRVATAERKLQLVNDPQVRSFGPYHVDCLICGAHVTLAKECDYDLTKWEEHKQSCSKRDSSPPLVESIATQPARIEEVEATPDNMENTVPFPTGQDLANHSPDSPEHTITPVTPLRAKRRRPDSDVGLTEEDVRPVNRQRRESYEPPEIEAPSVLGWFLLPLKAFVRGFRESLRGEDPPNI